MKEKISTQIQKGFTLIELIVVMAVIAILAGIVLVGLDPLEQIERGQDTARLSTINELGNAVLKYYTSQSTTVSTYPAMGATWQTNLQNAGEVNSVASNGTPTTTCTGYGQGFYCYTLVGNEWVIYTRAVSKSFERKPAATCATDTAWIVYSSAAGRSGAVCSAVSPVPTILTVY